MSIWITSPKCDGLGTGVVFLGAFHMVAQSPKSSTASGGIESTSIVF